MDNILLSGVTLCVGCIGTVYKILSGRIDKCQTEKVCDVNIKNLNHEIKTGFEQVKMTQVALNELLDTKLTALDTKVELKLEGIKNRIDTRD